MTRQLTKISRELQEGRQTLQGIAAAIRSASDPRTVRDAQQRIRQRPVSDTPASPAVEDLRPAPPAPIRTVTPDLRVTHAARLRPGHTFVNPDTERRHTARGVVLDGGSVLVRDTAGGWLHLTETDLIVIEEQPHN